MENIFIRDESHYFKGIVADSQDSVNITIMAKKGILDEKVYGWWLFDDLRLYGKEYSPSGIPLSADIIYYISTNEALKLLDIINKFE